MVLICGSDVQRAPAGRMVRFLALRQSVPPGHRQPADIKSITEARLASAGASARAAQNVLHSRLRVACFMHSVAMTARPPGLTRKGHGYTSGHHRGPPEQR